MFVYRNRNKTHVQNHLLLSLLSGGTELLPATKPRALPWVCVDVIEIIKGISHNRFSNLFCFPWLFFIQLGIRLELAGLINNVSDSLRPKSAFCWVFCSRFSWQPLGMLVRERGPRCPAVCPPAPGPIPQHAPVKEYIDFCLFLKVQVPSLGDSLLNTHQRATARK